MKIGIITQARMTSTRLPGKVLKEAGGKSLLAHHVDRLTKSGLAVYIATTVNETDNPIVSFCETRGIECWRGSEDNVLSRYHDCAVHYGLDIVVRVTSDCPLIDGALLRRGVDAFVSRNIPHLYASNTLESSYPRGFDFEIFWAEDLKTAFEKATEPYDLEHVTPYLRENKSGEQEYLSFCNQIDDSDLRVTVDTEEDFELIRRLIEDYQADQLTHAEITDILDQHPELVAINAHIQQKTK